MRPIFGLKFTPFWGAPSIARRGAGAQRPSRAKRGVTCWRAAKPRGCHEMHAIRLLAVARLHFYMALWSPCNKHPANDLRATIGPVTQHRCYTVYPCISGPSWHFHAQRRPLGVLPASKKCFFGLPMPKIGGEGWPLGSTERAQSVGSGRYISVRMHYKHSKL